MSNRILQLIASPVLGALTGFYIARWMDHSLTALDLGGGAIVVAGLLWLSTLSRSSRRLAKALVERRVSTALRCGKSALPSLLEGGTDMWSHSSEFERVERFSRVWGQGEGDLR